jgi:hypothetical protein
MGDRIFGRFGRVSKMLDTLPCDSKQRTVNSEQWVDSRSKKRAANFFRIPQEKFSEQKHISAPDILTAGGNVWSAEKLFSEPILNRRNPCRESKHSISATIYLFESIIYFVRGIKNVKTNPDNRLFKIII